MQQTMRAIPIRWRRFLMMRLRATVRALVATPQLAERIVPRRWPPRLAAPLPLVGGRRLRLRRLPHRLPTSRALPSCSCTAACRRFQRPVLGWWATFSTGSARRRVRRQRRRRWERPRAAAAAAAVALQPPLPQLQRRRLLPRRRGRLALQHRPQPCLPQRVRTAPPRRCRPQQRAAGTSCNRHLRRCRLRPHLPLPSRSNRP